MRTEKGTSKSKRAQDYLKRLRESVARKGGIFPGKNRESVIASLRKTREEIWEEKLAHRPGH